MAKNVFLIPSLPHGQRRPLTRQQLRRQMDALRPAVFFSRELCVRYYTYYGPGHWGPLRPL